MRGLWSLFLLPGFAFGQALDDRHLSVIPRTAEEAARIAAVLAAPGDFSRAEPFEELAGGAATVRASSTADAFSHA